MRVGRPEKGILLCHRLRIGRKYTIPVDRILIAWVIRKHAGSLPSRHPGEKPSENRLSRFSVGLVPRFWYRRQIGNPLPARHLSTNEFPYTFCPPSLFDFPAKTSIARWPRVIRRLSTSKNQSSGVRASRAIYSSSRNPSSKPVLLEHEAGVKPRPDTPVGKSRSHGSYGDS